MFVLHVSEVKAEVSAASAHFVASHLQRVPLVDISPLTYVQVASVVLSAQVLALQVVAQTQAVE